MSDKYKLEGHEVIPVDDLLEWAHWFETAKRHVAYNEIDGNVQVSTVFLGLDHSFGGLGRPVLFETMVFGGPLNGEQERYCTWDEAEAGHKAILEKVRTAAFGMSEATNVPDEKPADRYTVEVKRGEPTDATVLENPCEKPAEPGK
jgi:hypothetical protein